MSDEPKQGGYLRQAWLVILLALLYGAALAGVQTTLGSRIAENKRNETYSVIPTLVEGADVAKTEELTVTGVNGEEQRVYKAVAADGTQRGWVLPAHGQGFADRIDLLVGVDVTVSTITGLYVLDQKETPRAGSVDHRGTVPEPVRRRVDRSPGGRDNLRADHGRPTPRRDRSDDLLGQRSRNRQSCHWESEGADSADGER